jgi:hypothetical protein
MLQVTAAAAPVIGARGQDAVRRGLIDPHHLCLDKSLVLSGCADGNGLVRQHSRHQRHLAVGEPGQALAAGNDLFNVHGMFHLDIVAV